MGHVKDRWTSPGVNGRRVHNDRWGKGRRWQARWVDRTGQEHAQTFSTKDAADAHLRSVDLGVVTPARDLTFREYADKWLANQVQHRDATATLVRRYLARMVYPQIGGLLLADVDRNRIQAAVAAWSIDYAPSVVKVVKGYVSTIYKHAIDDKLVRDNPCVRISLPQQQKVKVRPYLRRQVLAVRDAMPAHYRRMVELGAATGLRQGELRGLTLDRVNFDTGDLAVDRQLLDRVGDVPVFGPPKTESSVRTLQMPQSAVAALKAHLDEFPVTNEWGLIFVNKNGHPMRRREANKVWHDNADGLGLPPRSGWHDLRHYCASLLIAGGLSPTAVAEWLGHKNAIETLQTYAHLWPSDHGRIIAAIDGDLNGLF